MAAAKQNKLVSAAVCRRCHKPVTLRRSKGGRLYLSEQSMIKPHDCLGYHMGTNTPTKATPRQLPLPE